MGEDALWIFGYGSLVWRPAFAHAERHAAWICGWERRFWQGSTDHRGVPGAPGRVVTLVPRRQAVCWGVAYRVERSQVDRVLDGLDHRERGGYQRQAVELHFAAPEGEGAPAAGRARARTAGEAITYLATPENPSYLGPAPLEVIAAQVRSSVGPSGPNREYVLRLAGELRALGAEDDHVYALAELVAEGEGAHS